MVVVQNLVVVLDLLGQRQILRRNQAGNLLADLTLKDSRSFRKELERIIAEVF